MKRFEREIAAVVKNKALMKLLAQRSKEKATVPLSEVRARLNGKRKSKKASPLIDIPDTME